MGPANLQSTQRRALHDLFDRIFKRGRRVQWNRKFNPATSKRRQVLNYVLSILMGFMMVGLVTTKAPVFIAATMVQAFTMLLAGMQVVFACSEILFHEQEADILLHRPVAARVILQAKSWIIFRNVYLQVWLFNVMATLFLLRHPTVTWVYIFAQSLALALNVLFTLGLTILTYHLGLKILGREKLKSMVTSTQVIAVFLIVFMSQGVLRYFRGAVEGASSQLSVWFDLLPPVWFGNLATLGAGASFSWFTTLGMFLAIVVPLVMVWLALGVLAESYESAVTALNEQGPPRKLVAGQESRWAERWAQSRWLRWWLGDPVQRVGFMLALAQITRVRNVKLKFFARSLQFASYPCYLLMSGVEMDSPWLAAIFPAVFSLIGYTMGDLILYSEEYVGADIFRYTPMGSPAALFYGARKATLLFGFFTISIIWAAILLMLGAGTHVVGLLVPGLLTGLICSYLPATTKTALIFAQSDPVGMEFSKGCLFQLMPMAIGGVVGGLTYLAHHWGFTPYWVGLMLILYFGLTRLFTHLLERQRLDLEAV